VNECRNLCIYHEQDDWANFKSKCRKKKFYKNNYTYFNKAIASFNYQNMIPPKHPDIEIISTERFYYQYIYIPILKISIGFKEMQRI